MGFVTPDDIVAKAQAAYSRFLTSWVNGTGAEFFPYRVRARFSVDAKNPRGTIQASQALLAQSKAQRGWGYTLHREQVRMRDFGNNPVPSGITIDTLDDLLRVTKREAEFTATRHVVEHLRQSLPQLSNWLIGNVGSLHKIAPFCEDVVQVAQFFISHPWPDCYARQIPLAIDTKFIERHEPLLRQWLDLVLPASGIDVNETKFARRFGLRDGQPHRTLRLLDSQLRAELNLPSDELSLPLKAIAELPVADATIIIVENDLNLLTLPAMSRGIGVRGEGNSVTRLERLGWLHTSRVLYWGDIDVDGFLILSRLRNLFPHVESILMDPETLVEHNAYIGDGNGSAPVMPTNLTPREAEAFAECSEHNRRLEQEKILQPFVIEVFSALRA